MDRYDVKEVMDQVHISSKMQEEIIMNIRKRMKNGNDNARKWNWRKVAVSAAAFVLAAGVISFPVRAFVISVVKERMESIPREEVLELNDMVQSKPTEADTFSREYSVDEEERSRELWQAYEDGKFPENVIAQVDNAEDAPEGTVCYVRSTGVFHLPAQEMTDEEILEIIDFQHKMSYAVSQGPAAPGEDAEGIAANSQGWTQEKIDEANRRDRAEREAKIKAAGGISEDEAIEIARKAMEADIGEKAKELEVFSPDCEENGWKLRLCEDDGVVYYYIQFFNKEEVAPEDLCNYNCSVNAVDGSIYEANSISGEAVLSLNIDDFVWYEH